MKNVINFLAIILIFFSFIQCSKNTEKDEYEIDNNLFKSNLIKIHYRDEDIESLLNDLNKNLETSGFKLLITNYKGE